MEISCFFFNIQYFAVYYSIFLGGYLYYFYNINNGHHIFLRTLQKFLIAGFSYAFIGFLYAYLKYNVNLSRPICEGDYITVVTKDSIRCLSSFPSGHSAIAILCAYSLWSFLPKIFKPVLVFMVVLICISRVALALHYPSDVFYSIMLSSSVIVIFSKIVGLMKQKIILPLGKRIFAKLRDI
jgi:membrane-associated phospholipid phosphatase